MFNIKFNQKNKLRVFEGFSGIGSQRMSLENIGVPHEVVAISEIDKFAIKSYMAIHGETLNLGDISKIDISDIPDHDLFTYSFPCQDISVAGKQGGFGKESGTRSGLLWECQKIINEKRPKYLLLENVKNLVKGKHLDGFNKWLEWLEEQGYTNYWDILNSKDFGVPQNRERVFVVSILGNHKSFEFPKGENSTSKIADIIMETVDKRYNNNKALRRVRKKNYIQYDNSGKGHDSQACRLYYLDSIMGTLPHSNSGDKTQVCSLKKDDNGVEYEWARRLNPQECWRMMGFKDDDYLKAEKVNSAIQLYRQAGNSIVVPVLEDIFKNMFID